MDRQRQPRGALLASNIPQLQNLIKRDPSAYKDEFLQQWNHYDSLRLLYHAKPDDNDNADRFKELVTFISQVSQCYPEETKEFPRQVESILMENYGSLSQDTRKSLVHNLVLLRNKGVISSLELLKTLFPLLPRTTSSHLRTFIRKTILTDIKTANLRTKNHKLNRTVQAMLFGMVERGMDAEVETEKGKRRVEGVGEAQKRAGGEAMWAIMLTKELWKKGIWNDAKTVSIVALGCFHPVIKVQSASLHFFLGSDEVDEDSDDEEDAPDLKGMRHKQQVGKKTKSMDRRVEKTLKAKKKVDKGKRDHRHQPNFPALQLLHDPQSFAEKLNDTLHRYDKKLSLDHKILIMQLLGRVTGTHKLCVLSFYTYVTKYLMYHQLKVTSILVSLAQSVHDLTPPDVLTPVIRKLAHEFVHPGVGSEVVAAGLNSIREICRRQPWCMEEDLLGDLIEYKKSKDKGVTNAARSLLALYREVNPGMLKRRERGKSGSMAFTEGKTALLPYGYTEKPAVGVAGLELLEEHFAQLRAEEGVAEGDEEMDGETEWAGWEVDSSDSDSDSSSGGWISVASDSEDIQISDSEDEGEGKKSNPILPEEPSPSAEPKEEKLSTLATTKILTPADFSLLNNLQLKAAQEEAKHGTTTSSASKRKISELSSRHKLSSADDNNNSAFLSEGDLLGPRKKSKADYESRIASIHAGREGREKFGSHKGKKRKEMPSSTTNREKQKSKPIMMILSSSSVRCKKSRSLRDKQKRLRAHIDKAKKSYK